MRINIPLLAISSLLLTGCADPAAEEVIPETPPIEETEVEPAEPGGISIQLPEVQITVNEKEGIQVRAPGTDVSVNEDGVNISAPQVELKSPAGTGE